MPISGQGGSNEGRAAKQSVARASGNCRRALGLLSWDRSLDDAETTSHERKSFSTARTLAPVFRLQVRKTQLRKLGPPHRCPRRAIFLDRVAILQPRIA